jgi:hypothetical protein
MMYSSTREVYRPILQPGVNQVNDFQKYWSVIAKGVVIDRPFRTGIGARPERMA